MSASIVHRVARLVGTRPARVYECRRCGTTVDRTTATCPACGDGDIVGHEVD